MDFKLVVHRLILREDKLELAISAQGPWEQKVRDPKLIVTFRNGSQSRRIPLVIRCYQKEEDGSCFVLASYTYNLKYLFYKQTYNRRIDFSFELRYGRTIIENIPFEFNSEDERVTEILTKEVAIGVADVESSSWRQEFVEYEIEYSTKSDMVSLVAKPGQEKMFKEHKVRKAINTVVMGIWRFILFWISVGLLPIFLVDAMLAVLGCQPKMAKIENNGLVYILKHARSKMDAFSKVPIGIIAAKFACMTVVHTIATWLPVKKNRIAFLSNRRDDLSGNFEFVNEILKKHPELDLKYVLDSRETKNMSVKTMIKMAWHMGNAKVVLVDDYSELFFMLPRRKGTALIQLWHACGAFKTFGCSRMGRPGGQGQQSPNHRNYDYATVSSQNIAKFYAEGFGISEDKVAATGIPRTDVFLMQNTRKKSKKNFISSIRH